MSFTFRLFTVRWDGDVAADPVIEGDFTDIRRARGAARKLVAPDLQVYVHDSQMNCVFNAGGPGKADPRRPTSVTRLIGMGRVKSTSRYGRN